MPYRAGRAAHAGAQRSPAAGHRSEPGGDVRVDRAGTHAGRRAGTRQELPHGGQRVSRRARRGRRRDRAGEIQKYWIADDCGTRLNPANVEGRPRAGSRKESARRCSRSASTTRMAQLLTSTFMDYLLPTIYEVPMTEKTRALHAVAVHAARRQGRAARARCTRRPRRSCARSTMRSPRSVSGVFEVPASPQRIWTALRAATRAQR